MAITVQESSYAIRKDVSFDIVQINRSDSIDPLDTPYSIDFKQLTYNQDIEHHTSYE